MAGSNQQLWLAWALVSAGFLLLLGMALFSTTDASASPQLARVRAWFLPGQTSHGHYQIELACEACHVKPFGGPELRQQACEGCHAAELKEAGDKHPLSKFTDPRNVPLLERIDATRCETCHAEHRPELTLAMGLTQPADLCVHCHDGIATERPSHAGMKFDTCSSAGCHRYHDNQATYEDFLLRHAEAPAMLARQETRSTNFAELAAVLPDYPSDRYPVRELAAEEADWPEGLPAAGEARRQWAHSAHARQGVNCSACHTPVLQAAADDDGPAESAAGGHGDAGDGPASLQWIAKPGDGSCAGCHLVQARQFRQGRHGMRLAVGLPPMRPREARLPMQKGAANRELGCASCHDAHRADRIEAARAACLGCHADEHSLAFDASPHGGTWARVERGEVAAAEAVSCATCHMPVMSERIGEFDLVLDHVQHNQNATLRPAEKMLRPVCMRCHGLGFATDALADAALVRNNFNGSPAVHVRSIRMAVERDEAIRRQRAMQAAAGAEAEAAAAAGTEGFEQ
ncbi:MAG: cytochrome c3 family protein [Pseudomonadota bacterium]|jgi:mono/diheme cytochrome c family protein